MGIKGRRMRKRLEKSLRVYLEKMRKIMHGELRYRAIPTPPTPTCLLSACKHPRTRSFAADRRRSPAAADGGGGSGRDGGGGAGDPAATLADVERFLLENFNSLYVNRDGDGEDGGGWSPAGSEVPEGAPPDAPTPQRFFVSPGTSVDSPRGEAGRRRSATSGASSSYSGSSSSSPPPPLPPPDPDDGDVPATCGSSVAVTTFSVNAYRDFRRSMEEMVDARHRGPHGEPLDWEFMEELLISYLELNDRRVHKDILGAFTDIAVAFRRRRGRQSTATHARIAGRRWPAEHGGGASEEAWEVEDGVSDYS